MAFHFRKARDTLRLFPSLKTIGFSTRANEGDGATVCANCVTESKTQSDKSHGHNISSSCNFPSALPVSYTDVTSILRLPETFHNNHNVGSVLKVIDPTCDDILTGSHTQSITFAEQIPLEVLYNKHTLRHMSALTCQPLSTSQSQPTGSINPSTMAGPSGDTGKGSGKAGPSPEQMHKLKEKLEKVVTKMFTGRLDYSLLHKNVVLENNLFGDNKTCMGMLAYGVEMLKLRLRIHARFSNVTVELQSVTMLEQAGIIRIHWRLKGVSQLQTLKFWRIFQSKTVLTKDDYEWLDAFSYFHIGKDGLVHKHRIDKMIPDDASGKDKLTETIRELLTPAKPLVS